jgi:hypothetical protein
LREELTSAAELFVQTHDGVFQFSRVVELLPFEDAVEDVQTIFVGSAGDLEIVGAGFEGMGQRSAGFRDGHRHGDGAGFGAGQIFELFLGEPCEQAL